MRVLPYLYLVQISFSYSIHINTSSYITCLTAMSLSVQAGLNHTGRSWGEHHIRSDSDMMALSVIPGQALWWSESQRQGREEEKETREMAWHFIQGSVFEVHVGVIFRPFVYRQGNTRGCQRSERFIETIYGTSTWPSQSIYYIILLNRPQGLSE